MNDKTDCELVDEFLSDFKPHHAIEIFQHCKPGCINWALRARVSNLRLLNGRNIINLRDSRENRTGIPVPDDIIQHYGRHDKQAVYLRLPDTVTERPQTFTQMQMNTTI